MNTVIYRSPSFVLKTLQDQGQFSGYASTHAIDHSNDRILPGAFSKTLDQWTCQRGRFPHIHFEHDAEEIIGLCKRLQEDDHGLYVQGKLLLDLPKAQQAYFLLQRGLNGLSIGFFVLKAFSKGGVRHIQELILKEVSFVKDPCNAEARVHEYKSGPFYHDPTLMAHIERLKRTLID